MRLSTFSSQIPRLVAVSLLGLMVLLTGVTPGGEAKVASEARPKNRNRQAGTAWYDPRDYFYPPRPERRGLFGRRWFGDPYYAGPQGYFRQTPGYYPPRGYRRYAE